MGLYQHVRTAWKKPKESNPDLWKQRLIAWRREPVTVRLERPTRIDRARSLGYRAIQGLFVVRQRVSRGGRQREQIRKGRRSKAMRRKKIVSLSYQTVAEQRAAKKFLNCEVLNSYLVAEDGNSRWFEIIMVDRNHPRIKADKKLAWVTKPGHTGRAERGLTSSAKASRGLRNRGKGAEKVRPSLRANNRRAH